MKKCKQAQQKVMDSVSAFGDHYFYDLNLNRKLCRGIEQAKEVVTYNKRYNKAVLELFYYWWSKDCSKQAYSRIERVISNQKIGIQREFQSLFFGKIIFSYM